MKSIAALFLLLFSISAAAQQALAPLNFEWMQETEAQVVRNRGMRIEPALLNYEADTGLQALGKADGVQVVYPLHTALRPWIENSHPIRKSITYYNAHQPQPAIGTGFGGWLGRWHRQNSLLQVERQPQQNEPFFRLYIDPLLNLQAGTTADTANGGRFWINTRGITARGDIGSKISFETSFLENQAILPVFMADYAEQTGVIPGQGRWKRFGTNGYDFAMASGYLSYTPSRWFSLQVGHGKHFVGDGYRSLLLSDNSFNYPYARLTGTFGASGQFQFTSVYASLMNLQSVSPVPPGTERLFQKKPAAFQLFSWRPLRTVELSLFQGVVWRAADSTNRQQTGFLYFNPIPGIGPAVEGLNGTNNYLLGLTGRVDLFRTLSLYGQLMLDGTGNRRKSGVQAGFKYFDAFTVKHLHLQGEVNVVKPFAYSTSDPAQAWTHYGQPLAHPVGAAFTELSGNFHYKLKDFFIQARGSLASIDFETGGNNGQSPFVSDTLPTIGVSGPDYKLMNIDMRVGWVISYASNLNVSAGITLRSLSGPLLTKNESLLYISLRTSLSNLYTDFF